MLDNFWVEMCQSMKVTRCLGMRVERDRDLELMQIEIRAEMNIHHDDDDDDTNHLLFCQSGEKVFCGFFFHSVPRKNFEFFQFKMFLFIFESATVLGIENFFQCLLKV